MLLVWVTLLQFVVAQSCAHICAVFETKQIQSRRSKCKGNEKWSIHATATTMVQYGAGGGWSDPSLRIWYGPSLLVYAVVFYERCVYHISYNRVHVTALSLVTPSIAQFFLCPLFITHVRGWQSTIYNDMFSGRNEICLTVHSGALWTNCGHRTCKYLYQDEV